MVFFDPKIEINSMERVYIASDPSEVVIVQSRLNSAGIESKVVGDDLFNLRGALPIEDSTLPTIFVDVKDLPQAQKVIEAYEEFKIKMNQEGGFGEDWVCSKCSETLEAQFATCWSCGTSRNTE